MIRVKVVVSGNLDLFQYEADVIVYQQAVENFVVGADKSELKQVPAVVVRLDSGEIKVQPLQMDKQLVQVFQLDAPLSGKALKEDKHSIKQADLPNLSVSFDVTGDIAGEVKLKHILLW